VARYSFRMRVRSFVGAARRCVARVELGVAGLIVLLGGIVVVAASVVVFGGATEDVTQRNGQALYDVSRLRVFTDHRSDVLVRVSKLLTDLGAVPVLAVLAIVAGVLLWRRGLPLAVAVAPALSLGV